MFRFFQNTKRSLDSLLNLIIDLVADGHRRPVAFAGRGPPRPGMCASGTEERQVQPRRLNDSARFSLILWSRLCNWKEALVIFKPGSLIGWSRQGFPLFLEWESQTRGPRIP